MLAILVLGAILLLVLCTESSQQKIARLLEEEIKLKRAAERASAEESHDR